MNWEERERQGAEAFALLAQGLAEFEKTLPQSVKRKFERDNDAVSLDVEPPTSAHRRLLVDGFPTNFEYSLGKIWTENIDATPEAALEILAACDAIRDGWVREVRDLRTGVLYHVYRLKTHGLNKYLNDGQYSLWHWLRRKVRRVKIQRLPPLSAH